MGGFLSVGVKKKYNFFSHENPVLIIDLYLEQVQVKSYRCHLGQVSITFIFFHYVTKHKDTWVSRYIKYISFIIIHVLLILFLL